MANKATLGLHERGGGGWEDERIVVLAGWLFVGKKSGGMMNQKQMWQAARRSLKPFSEQTLFSNDLTSLELS